MVKNIDIYDYIDSFAPFNTALDFDNAGLLVGSKESQVTTVLLALDITREVVEEAAVLGAQLVVSHHPVIFNPIKRLDFDSVPALLAANKISAICAHTNLDKAYPFGVNTALADACGLVDCNVVAGEDCFFIANTKTTLTANSLAKQIKGGLSCDGITFTVCNDKIDKVGLCSGAGGDEIFAAIKSGCDAFITGEIRHHEIMAANENGLSVFVVGHYKSEDVVIEPLAKKLAQRFPSVKFVKSKVFTDGLKYI